MALGSPKTRKALIGTFDLRIGPQTLAGKLTADHSVGIIDQVKLDLQMDSVDLMSGFPQKPVDTAITKFVTGFTATLRESSRRNLNVLLGNGLFAYDAANLDVSTSVTVPVGGLTTAATALTIAAPATGSFAAGDTVVIYDVANPGNVTISVIATLVGTAVTLQANLGLAADIPAGASVRIYKAQTIAGGNITGVNYFAAQLIRLDRGTSRPVGFNFWKTAISSGLSLSASVTEFASLELQLKALEPAASEYATGANLAHLATIIPGNPVFQAFDVADSAVA
jgi:hypothetical protein